MIAALPMYDRRETAGANDALWALTRASLADHGIPAPARLTREGDPWDIWVRPDLVLAQTCGLPYRTALHGRVELLAAPVCDIDCPAGHYFSVIITQKDSDPDDWETARAAVNDGRSQSGWAALCDWAGRTDICVVMTGAHVASAKAVADGRADLAAIDAVTWTMIQRWEPWAKDLRVIAQTKPTPTLPYIAAKGADADAITSALRQAIAALSQEAHDTLCLKGLVAANAQDYLAVATPDPPK